MAGCQTSNKAWTARNRVLLCFLAVSTTECSSRNASVPKSERNVHEFFNLIFSLRIPRSLALLSDGIIGSSRNLKIWTWHFINPPFQCVKILAQFTDIPYEQAVQALCPWGFVYNVGRWVFLLWIASRNRPAICSDHFWLESNSKRYCSSLNKCARHTWWFRKWSAKYALCRSVTAVTRSKLSLNR